MAKNVSLKEITPKPVAELSDDEVLATAELRMEQSQGARLGELLDCQQAGNLNEAEQTELAVLMQFYQESLVRKAQALSEAFRRGLRESI